MEHEWVRLIPCGVFALMTVWFLTVLFTGIVNVGSVVGFAVSLILTVGFYRLDAVLKTIAALWKTGGGKLLIVLAALILAALAVLAIWFSVRMAGQASNEPKEEDLPVIVLGCKVNGDTPSRMLRFRLEAAQNYLEQHPDAVCVVSGGQGHNETRTEAGVMKEWLISKGITADRILAEEGSMNTEQNLQYSKEMLENVGISCEKAILITDGYHQYRASLFAKREGITAYAVSAKTEWHLLPTYWIREWFGLCKLYVFG